MSPLVVSKMGEAEMEKRMVKSLVMSAASPSKHLSLSPSFQRCAFASWVRDNINKKECCHFKQCIR